MKRLALLTGLVALAIAMQAQSTLYFRFANTEIKEGAPSYLVFDIELKAGELDTYQRDLQVFIDYNPDAFGENIVSKGRIELEKLDLMQGETDDSEKYKFIKITDVNDRNRFAFLTEFTTDEKHPGPAFFNMVPTEYTGFVRVKMEIKDDNQKAGIKFVEELMSDGQYYAKTDSKPYKYEKVVLENSLADKSLK